MSSDRGNDHGGRVRPSQGPDWRAGWRWRTQDRSRAPASADRRMPLAPIALLLIARAAGAAGSPPALAALLARADAAYTARDEPGKLDEVEALLGEAEKIAPGEYGVLWRQARLLFWK